MDSAHELTLPRNVQSELTAEWLIALGALMVA